MCASSICCEGRPQKLDKNLNLSSSNLNLAVKWKQFLLNFFFQNIVILECQVKTLILFFLAPLCSCMQKKAQDRTAETVGKTRHRQGASFQFFSLVASFSESSQAKPVPSVPSKSCCLEHLDKETLSSIPTGDLPSCLTPSFPWPLPFRRGFTASYLLWKHVWCIRTGREPSASKIYQLLSCSDQVLGKRKTSTDWGSVLPQQCSLRRG